MGDYSDKSKKRKKKKHVDDTRISTSLPYSSESSSSDDIFKSSSKRHKHSIHRRHGDERRTRKRSSSRREEKKRDRNKRDKKLLQMIDDGQAVDIRGLSERSLVKHLRKLFLSLNLKENGDLVFLLPSNVGPTLEIVGSIIYPNVEPQIQQADNPVSEIDVHSIPRDAGCSRQGNDDFNLKLPSPKEDAAAPRRRVIGPEMPSAELLAAAAKLTEAEAELRDAEMDGEGEVFIGPPPPAVVKEAESANEAERFEEVTRIMGAEVDSPYDIVGVNRNISAENIKKSMMITSPTLISLK